MKLKQKLLKCKEKIDKVALREPRTGYQVRDRLIWERLRKILIVRYDYHFVKIAPMQTFVAMHD